MAAVETLNAARGKLSRSAARFAARHGRGLPPLILMTDDRREVDWREAAAALPRGAAVIVRHRDGRAREALARSLLPVCKARHVKLLIADDAALALRIRADGLHLPERRAVRAQALKVRHPRWFVTVAVHKVSAAAGGADAVIVAPVFATASHPGRESLGLVRFALLARSANAAYALGGIDARSADRLAALPLAGIALIGGWTVRS
jgi:thiamine-phosphate pyrophosphorylase